MVFEPAPRLNILTGDNGLGKSFLLDCLWWMLTGRESEEPIYPRPELNRADRIALTVEPGAKQREVVEFNWDFLGWARPSFLAGSVWDPDRDIALTLNSESK
jgi:hypothetical protein